jgi:hypothetical protein
MRVLPPGYNPRNPGTGQAPVTTRRAISPPTRRAFEFLAVGPEVFGEPLSQERRRVSPMVSALCASQVCSAIAIEWAR